MGVFELNATLIAELVLFAVVVAIVAKIVVPPLRRAMQERQATISKGLADAEAAEVRLAEAEREYERHLNAARQEGREILDAYRAMAAALAADSGRQGPAEAAATSSAVR